MAERRKHLTTIRDVRRAIRVGVFRGREVHIQSLEGAELLGLVRFRGDVLDDVITALTAAKASLRRG